MRKKIAIYLTFLAVWCLTIATATADISPADIEASLAPGESISETKTVTITGGVIPKADIIFAFDLTGSMFDELVVVQAEAGYIMDDLDQLIGDARYGVISFMDYNCYGGDPYLGDYPYELNQDITNNRDDVMNAINSLETGWGGDFPENYTRIMYESYADTSISYREGSKKILILFGDAIPHDCDLNEGVPGKEGTWSTDPDPGRDGEVGTDDDLDLQTVLQEMAAHNVTLLYVQGNNPWPIPPDGSELLDYWKHWTGLTGGAAYQLTAASEIPNVIYQLIEAEAAEATHLDELTLEVTTPGYESWLTSVTPSSYTGIVIEGTEEFTFDIVITVPEDVCEASDEGEVTHEFVISAMGDGASYGDQKVTIDVACGAGGVDPEVGIDIKPGSCPNPLNVKSKGVLPVAVLGTEEFDITAIDPSTVQLEGVAPIRWVYEDVATPFEGELCDCHDLDGDGYLDLTLKFDTQQVVAALNDVNDGDELVLTLTGELFDDGIIQGEDCVWILKKGKGKK